MRDVEVLNEQTDRLFFVSETGLVQCFHEVGLEYPLIHAGPGLEPQAPPQVQQQGLPATEAEPGAPPADENPFGGEVDPFGGGAAPKKAAPPAEENPFGAGGLGGEAPPAETTTPPGDDPFATP
jgi:hypothetical protein